MFLKPDYILHINELYLVGPPIRKRHHELTAIVWNIVSSNGTLSMPQLLSCLQFLSNGSSS